MAFTYLEGIPHFISGNRVIQFHKSSDLRKDPTTLDLPTTAEYFESEDGEMHLGELGFFGQKTTVKKPLPIDILENRQVLETKNGKFTYNVPFYKNDQCITKRDTSNEQEAPGIDEGTFKLVLSQQFKPWDVLTTDLLYGQEVIVTEDTVLQTGDSFEHIVRLNTTDKNESYEKYNLKEGVKYFKSYNILGGERDTFLTGVSVPNKTSMLTCEFEIGSGSGAELDVSAMANIKSLASNYKQGMIKELNMSFDEFSKKFGDVGIVMDYKNGEILTETARLANVAEWLVKREHLRIIDNRTMFAKKSTVSVGAGYVHISEGLWHQLRRGKIIPYSRKGGITRDHIKEAVEYVFQGNDMQPEKRQIKFKLGRFAYENLKAIFSEEFNDQMGRLSNITNLFGTDGQIPKSPISGPLNNLEIEEVSIGKIVLPGIGTVEAEYDASLDTLGSMADRLSSGIHGHGYTHGAYAMLIWDAAKQSYSNNNYTPTGVDFVEGAPEKSNVYLVKKPGPLIYSGRVNGYYDPYKSEDILSSGNRQRFAQYFSWDPGCAYFLSDPSSFVMIELAEQDRRGYN